MKNDYLFNKVRWLRCSVLGLLIWPLSVAAVDHPTGVKEQTLRVGQVINKVEVPNETVTDLQQKENTRSLTGIIVDDADGSPIIGANILIKGDKTGVISDANGRFSIRIPDKGAVLEISYIGYRKETVYITDQGIVNIRIKGESELLNEVVIVGAGTQKKISVTGAISTIEGSELIAPSSSLTSNLAGKLAGVLSRTSSGEPGTTSEFYIRGVGTFGGRATPLILLDGVEISTGDLDLIPAETILNFSILKDASATAIYGSRGANGVMLVTTKSGVENQRAKINVSVESSLQKPMHQMEYVDGATWMETYNEAATTRGGNSRYSQEAIDMTRHQTAPYRYPDVDWNEMLFKDMAMNQRANINISGGGTRLTYYMSLQANHDTGMLDIPNIYSFNNNINDWKFNFQNNIGYKLTSSTKLSLRMNTQFGTLRGPNYSATSLFSQGYNTPSIAFPAYFPAQEKDGHVRFGNAYLSGDQKYTNPYAYMLSSFNENNFSTINTAVSLDQQLDFITKGLSVRALVSMKTHAATSFNRTVEPYYYMIKEGSWDASNPNDFELDRVGTSGNEYVSESGASTSTDRTIYIDARIDYSRRFGSHSVSSMLMYMQRESRSGVLPNRNQGFSGRATYDYDHRYLAEFNFGYNGTERLAKGERFEFFPAMSLGWVISNEKFWEPMADVVDYFKLRGSYGIVGSDGTGSGAGHFLYFDQVNLTGGGSFSSGVEGNYSLSGPGFTGYAIQDACWERVNKLNIGVDLKLFNQLHISADYFYDHRYKILLKRGAWPIIMGYGSAIPWSNIGQVDNKGFDMSIHWKKEVIKDLWVDLRGNFTYNNNQYVKVDDPAYPYVWQTNTGKPLSFVRGYIAEGLFSTQEEITHSPTQSLGSAVMPGDIKYRDVNADGIINSNDEVMLSPYGGFPRIQYGFGLSASYKKFDFGVFFNGSAKRTIMINGLYPFCSDNGQPDHNLMQFIADNHWSEKKPNPNAAYPRLGVLKMEIENNMVSSSYWMRNGNFLRFKSLSLGYSFPRIRLFFNADNLAVWSPFKDWDPEQSWNSYPMQRTFNIGAQFNF